MSDWPRYTCCNGTHINGHHTDCPTGNGDFCPTLPAPNVALVLRYGSAKWQEGETDDCQGSRANIKANHAAADAEHALRVAILDGLRVRTVGP